MLIKKGPTTTPRQTSGAPGTGSSPAPVAKPTSTTIAKPTAGVEKTGAEKAGADKAAATFTAVEATPTDRAAGAAERAAAYEDRAVHAPTRAEKRTWTARALSAWMDAATGDSTLASTKTHGAQKNAERAAERLAALSDDAATRSLAEGVAHALRGALSPAQAALSQAVAQASAGDALPVRRAGRAALLQLADAQGALALDGHARALVEARAHVDPRAGAARVVATLEPMAALIAQHPRQALAFAALYLEAKSAAGSMTPLSSVLDVIKDAGRAQSQARVPAVAGKALLLAHAQRLSGNVKGAEAAYRRVLTMTSSSETELAAAQLSLVRLSLAGGPQKSGEALEGLQRLGERGPLHAGLAALCEAQVLVRGGGGGKSAALAVLDAALAGLRVDGRHATAPAASGLHTRLAAAAGNKDGGLGGLVGDGAALAQALLEAKGAIARGREPGLNLEATVSALSALDVAQQSGVPLRALLSTLDKGSAGAATDGPAAALLTLTAAPLMLESPVAVAQGADSRSLGGLLAHVVTGQRGDAPKPNADAAALSLGLAVARRALPSLGSPAAVVDVTPPGAPANAATLSRLGDEVKAALADGKTASVESLDEGRRRLMAKGWQAHPGTTSLTKDGARVAFEPFSIAQTPAFHARLQTVADDGAASTHARSVHIGKLAFSDAEWGIFEEGYAETMKRYQRALHTPQGARFQAGDIADIRALVSLGRPVEAMPERREQLQELSGLKAKATTLLQTLQQQGKAPSGAMFFVEGIDAASKTTNGMALKGIFEAQGFAGSWSSFKAPTAEERQQHWLARFEKRAPAQGEVFLADRTYMGEYAYNTSLTPERLQELSADAAGWQKNLEARGVLVLKLLFDPRVDDTPGAAPDDVLWRPMLTFGKREARALIARDLLERAGAAGLSPEDRAGLEAACLGPGYNDLKSFHEGGNNMDRFRAFADENDARTGDAGAWERVGTKDRHAGRVHALQALVDKLEALQAG